MSRRKPKDLFPHIAPSTLPQVARDVGSPVCSRADSMARSPASLALLPFVFMSTGACREERPHPKPAPRASVPHSLPAGEPRWTVTRSFPLDAAAYRAVAVWNDALNRHDLSKFKEIYTDEVFFYGYKRSRADVT